MVAAKSPHALYLCYFGLREPLVQTQVLPYLRQIKAGGIEISLLTFEPRLRQTWTKAALAQAHAALAAEGLDWHYLPYHKTPSLPATLYDIARGTWLAARLVRRRGINILHARSHVPALMGTLIKRISGGRLIFDIRGFMPEEYTDAGNWPANGYLYQLTKMAERRIFHASDAFVVLTEKAREILFPRSADRDPLGRPFEVIPCCIDPARFRAADAADRDELRAQLQLAGRRVIAYVGSFGTWYLADEMAQFLARAHAQDPTTFSLIMTQTDPATIVGRLRALGVAAQDFSVQHVPPPDVPRYLKAADAAISFIKACYSKQSSSPTKIAEYLASGLPIICNTGVGDLDELIETERVGVLLREFSPAAYDRALVELAALQADATLAARCRAVAARRFNLETVGGAKYQRLYRRLLQGKNGFSV